MPDYFRLCCKRAWEDAKPVLFGKTWPGIITAAFTAVASFAIQSYMERVMDIAILLSSLAAGVIGYVAVFLFFLLLSFLAAPFRIHREDQERVADRREESDVLKIEIARLKEENAKLQHTIAAQEAYTEELNRQREARERDLDPHIQAFREARHKEASAGEVLGEESLNYLFRWISEKSAWVRWLIAQHTANNLALKGEDLFHIIAVYFGLLLRDGTIIVRGCRKGEVNYEEIRPDFWKWAGLVVNRDPVQIWKVSVVSLGGVSLPDYVDLRCSRKIIREFFPESNEQFDARSQAILDEVTSGRSSKATSSKEDE